MSLRSFWQRKVDKKPRHELRYPKHILVDGYVFLSDTDMELNANVQTRVWCDLAWIAKSHNMTLAVKGFTPGTATCFACDALMHEWLQERLK